jgi:hypothetical protein
VWEFRVEMGRWDWDEAKIIRLMLCQQC